MGLVKSKSSRHIDEPPKYDETNEKQQSYNPYNIEKTITAEEASELTKIMHEERYTIVIKSILKSIYDNIKTYTEQGKTTIMIVFGSNEPAGSNFVLNFGDKNIEAIYYKRLCDEIYDILSKNGFIVEFYDPIDKWVYGIPNYAKFKAVDIKWYKN